MCTIWLLVSAQRTKRLRNECIASICLDSWVVLLLSRLSSVLALNPARSEPGHVLVMYLIAALSHMDFGGGASGFRLANRSPCFVVTISDQLDHSFMM